MTTVQTRTMAAAERQQVEGSGWSLEIIGSSLDNIGYRGDPVLRAIRVVVRDHDWHTIPSVLESVSTSGSEHSAHDTTSLTLRASHEELGVKATWTATVRLSPGRLHVDLDFQAGSAFSRNRIGLIALHPLRLAGRALLIEHPDGSETSTTYPINIAPHQPAVDISALRWSTTRHDVRLGFTGDVFEMEDQRNWTDASYKTYSTPLDRPFPVPMLPGDQVKQSAVLEIPDSPRSPAPLPPDLTPASGLIACSPTVPQILVGASTAPGHCAQRPTWLHGACVLVELDLRDPGWPTVLARARQDAGGQALDVRLTASTPQQVDPAIAALCGLPIIRLGVVDSEQHITTAPLWERLRELTQANPVTGLLIGGTSAHFTELNRSHQELPPDLEGLTFSSTPQMHDLSSEQLAESLTVQRQTAQQAVTIAAGRPVHIGPVTLRARFNAVATSPHIPTGTDIDKDGYGAEAVWNSTDPRQKTDKYATWLLASAIALSVPGVDSICLAEAWGPRGFGDDAGNAYPAAEVLSWLISAQGAEISPLPPEDIPPGLAVLATHTGEQSLILAANTTGLSKELQLGGLTVKLDPWARIRVETPAIP